MKIHRLKTLLPLILIILGINACSDGSGGTGSIGDKQPPVSPTPVEPTDPGLVDLDDFNGIYFNPETKQIALIDVDEQYQVMLQNYYNIDEEGEPHLHLVEGLEAGETEATSGATTTWTFDNNKFETSGQTLYLSDDGNTLTVTNNDSSIVSNPDGDNPELKRQPDSLPIEDLTMELRLDINDTTWTIKESGYFQLNLRGLCIFTGTLEDSGKGYYVTDNATLLSDCEGDDFSYKEGSYTTKLYSFDSEADDGTPMTYIATVSIHNGDGASQRPIFSVIAVTLRKEPIDGVYYANRYAELKDDLNISCNDSTYCSGNSNIATDGTYGQIIFIDFSKPYNVVIHKALAGAPNTSGGNEPLFDVIFMKAAYGKDALGNVDKTTLTATEYYVGASMGLAEGDPLVKEPNTMAEIKLTKNDSEAFVTAKIGGEYLFSGDKAHNTKFKLQAPTPLTNLLLHDVKDRSGVVWRVNRPNLDGSGITYWAKSKAGTPFSDACDVPKEYSAVSGTSTNEKDYYYTDIDAKNAIDPNYTLTTNIYGFTAEDFDDDGDDEDEIYLSSSVISNDPDNFKLAIGGGLYPKSTDVCPTP